MVGLLALGYCGWVRLETFLYQRVENQELDRILHSNQSGGSGKPPGSVTPQVGSRIGRIEIRRLGVSAIVLSGSDASTLQRSVGHIPGTAVPGALGNVGLAGHRDTFFRRLKDIKPDDEVLVTTERGIFRYRVEGTRVVEPSDVWVLDPTSSPTLTLVTCFPFSYIGPAPQRFVVRASLRG